MNRRLTDDDVTAIVAALQAAQHDCRFDGITPRDLRDTVEFFQGIRQAKTETGAIIRKTIVVAGVTGTLAILGWGVIARLKAYLGL